MTQMKCEVGVSGGMAKWLHKASRHAAAPAAFRYLSESIAYWPSSSLPAPKRCQGGSPTYF